MSELTESTEYPPLDKNSELEHFFYGFFKEWLGSPDEYTFRD